MDQNPKIAIVMPYYNELDLLKKSVDGVMKQTYTNWKLFIVDDGSIKENRADHNIIQNSQIKIINKPNSGVSDARNRALDHLQAEGGFGCVAYCDSDDVWSPSHLQEALNTLLDAKADMVYSVPEFKFIDGTIAVPFGIPIHTIYPGNDELYKQNFIWISGVMHKKEYIQPEGFDKELNSLEDWDMWIRIARAGAVIKHNIIQFPTFTYTVKTSGNGSKCTDEIRAKLNKKHNLA